MNTEYKINILRLIYDVQLYDINQMMKLKKFVLSPIVVLLLSTMYVSFCCTDMQNNCTSCNDVNTCGTCQLGYGTYEILSSSPIITQCQPCIPTNCQECTVSNSCTKCTSGYRIKSSSGVNICEQCQVSNCNRCNGSPTVCSECMFYYRYEASNNTCQRCNQADCILCNADIYTCTKCCCRTGVNSINSSCTACRDSFCLDCSTNYNNCLKCQTGYGVQDSRCVSCSRSNCLQCGLDASNCTKCSIGYGAIHDGTCQACSKRDCLTCDQYDAIKCSSCLQGFGLSGTRCRECDDRDCRICSSNYRVCQECKSPKGLLDGIPGNTCQPCISICVQCMSSNNSACISCDNDYYLDNITNSCILCTTIDVNCTNCSDASTCTACLSGSYVNPSATCTICPQFCATCQYSLLYASPSCIQCQPNYGIISYSPDLCGEFCGDFQAINTPCDNQIGVPYDGCNDICQVQDGFQCRKVNYTSTCSYINQVYLEILDVVREQFANAFTMRVKVWPPLYVFKTSDLKGVFFIDDPTFTIESITLDPQTNELVFKVSFSADYLDRNILVEFIPDENIDERYFASISSNALKLVSLVYYPEWVLQSSKFSLYLFYLITVMGNIGALIGLISKRLAGLQALFVYQLAFLSIVWVNSELYLPFQVIFPLKYINGYHIRNLILATQQNTGRLLQTSESLTYPYPHTQQFYFDEKLFVNNFNIFFVFQILSLISYAITSIIITYIRKKNIHLLKTNKQSEQIARIRKHINRTTIAREYSASSLMYFGLLNMIYFIACSYLFFRNNQFQTISIALFSIVAATYVLTFILFCFDSDPFDYFRYSFRKTRVALNFYYVFPFIIASSAILLIMLKLTWLPLIPLIVFLPIILLYRPYSNLLENFRSAFNLLVIMLWFSLRILLDTQPQKLNNVFALNFINILLLFVVMVISYISLIHYIVYICYMKKQLKVDEEKVMQELQMINVREQIQKAKNDSLIFRKLLQPRINILQFSNNLISPKNINFQHEQPSVQSVNRMIKKQVKQQCMIKPEIKQIVEQKKKIIENLKYKMQDKQIQIPRQEAQQNAKLIYAMEVLNMQNKYLRLKNANDFTLKLMEQKDQENQQNYLQNYKKI